MYLYKNIKHLREGRSMNQTQLGEVLGLTKEAISGYETGRKLPKIDSLLKLSEIFDVSIDDLIKRDIEAEGTSGKPRERPGNEAEKDAVLADKIAMLEKQIALYDKLLQQQDPDWGKKSGLEE